MKGPLENVRDAIDRLSRSQTPQQPPVASRRKATPPHRPTTDAVDAAPAPLYRTRRRPRDEPEWFRPFTIGPTWVMVEHGTGEMEWGESGLTYTDYDTIVLTDYEDPASHLILDVVEAKVIWWNDKLGQIHEYRPPLCWGGFRLRLNNQIAVPQVLNSVIERNLPLTSEWVWLAGGEWTRLTHYPLVVRYGDTLVLDGTSPVENVGHEWDMHLYFKLGGYFIHAED